jgi:hypothetical protein
LYQSVSDVRQKSFFVPLDRLANAVISRRPLLALWKAGHQPVQLILDFRPIPIGHRLPLLPHIEKCLTAIYLSSPACGSSHRFFG